MLRSTRFVFVNLLTFGFIALPNALVVRAADAPPAAPPPVAPPAATSPAAPAAGVSGQDKYRFKVLLTSDSLPDVAQQNLKGAHGGFAVDNRPGKGETYFFLRGAGILQISADLSKVRLLPTADAMKNLNMHHTTIWYGPAGEPYLTFAANDAEKIFTTDIDGKLLHTLNKPAPGQDLGNDKPNDYFAKNGKFAPTAVEYLDGRYYVTTGYSDLDYVLTAQVTFNPFSATWSDLSFGGKGKGVGQFMTGHAITRAPGTKRLDVSDRPNSEIDRFNKYGHYQSTVNLPTGTLVCDVDYLGKYALVPALDGPDRTKGAPIYLLENDKVISTIMPKEELGLTNFKHIHDAILREVNGKLYIITQAWNPGDFAILEQVTE
jgi:hypothetical protein